MGIPSKLKNMNVYGDGNSYLGQVPEVGLPKLGIKTEGYRGGGMIGEVEIDMGLDKLEMEINAGGLTPGLIAMFGASAHDAAMVRFAGAYQSDQAGRVQAVEVVARGRYTEIDMGKAKPGDGTEHKYKLACSYYRLIIDGSDLIEIDVIAGVFIVDGIDRYAEIRAAIGA